VRKKQSTIERPTLYSTPHELVEEYRVCRYAYSYEAQASADDSINKSITMGPLKGYMNGIRGLISGGRMQGILAEEFLPLDFFPSTRT
jgi:hypothetical protein